MKKCNDASVCDNFLRRCFGVIGPAAAGRSSLSSSILRTAGTTGRCERRTNLRGSRAASIRATTAPAIEKRESLALLEIISPLVQHLKIKVRRVWLLSHRILIPSRDFFSQYQRPVQHQQQQQVQYVPEPQQQHQPRQYQQPQQVITKKVRLRNRFD